MIIKKENVYFWCNKQREEEKLGNNQRLDVFFLGVIF